MVMTRRHVVAATSAAVGVSLVPFSRIVDAQRAPRTDDAVLNHVGREFGRLYRTAKAGRLRSEHLLSAAANFRLMAVALPNDVVKKAAARGALQTHSHDLHARQTQEVRKRFGMDISAEAPPPPSNDNAAIVATLAREGLAPTLLRIAATLETRAAQVASREGVSTPFRLAQGSAYPYCNYLPAANTAMDILCAAAYWLGPQGAAACAVATASFWTYYYLCF